MSEYETKQAAERAARAAYARRTEELAKIIRPLRTARYEVDSEWGYFRTMLKRFEEDYGGLEMNPEFQRGHVWAPEQKQCYLENILRGVVSTSGFLVQFNCPNWDDDSYVGDLPRGMQCIDGLQRITAVMEFLDGEVRPFGFTPKDLERSGFAVKGNFRFRVAVHNFTNKAELLQHYLDLNTGGTPHSPEEIARVRALLEAALSGVAPKGKPSGPGM